MPTIGISCVETRAYENASVAIAHTLRVCQNLPIKKLYWLSDAPYPKQSSIEGAWGSDFLEWVRIKPFIMSQPFNDQYSALTLDLLPEVVQTDFNLVIQADGYAVNANAWSDEFYGYDYIGATWPKDIEGRNVGNGGFSWRSKRLYEALLDLRSRYALNDVLPNALSLEGREDRFGAQSIPEDSLIGKVYRPLLESKYGIRFAPTEIADQFSIETKVDSPWMTKSFGFHGRLTGSFYIHQG